MLIFLIFTFGTLQYTSRPDFCASCHEMKAEYTTWQESAHSRVNCTTCHIPPGMGNFIKHKISALEQVYRHVFHLVPDKIVLKDPIPNEVCLKCHVVSREVTASGDLIVPHAKHIKENGALCVDCHARSTHGGLAETKDFQPTEANLVKLTTLESKDFRPRMAECMGCHNGQKAFYTCDRCHKTIKTPPTHDNQTWASAHGELAKADVVSCIKCHSIPLGKFPDLSKPTLAEEVRSNDFCLDCHLKRPPSHNQTWALGHAREGKADRIGCLVCHDEQKPASPEARVNPVYCTKCHSQVHPKTWKLDHPLVVKKDGMGNCMKCHDASSCQRCHDANNVKR
ncbi:MAG: NapC/NirT family cytochrome c [Firmicutes bacterium]|nr:NapC/NirT family cytochrome c [Bacillota bacterium]